MTLFKLGKYHYQVLVTNLSLQSLNLWRLYNDGPGVELIIRQLKGEYAPGSVPTQHFFANEIYFHLLLLAYNLVNWFKRLCLPPRIPNGDPADPPTQGPAHAGPVPAGGEPAPLGVAGERAPGSCVEACPSSDRFAPMVTGHFFTPDSG